MSLIPSESASFPDLLGRGLGASKKSQWRKPALFDIEPPKAPPSPPPAPEEPEEQAPVPELQPLVSIQTEVKVEAPPPAEPVMVPLPALNQNVVRSPEPRPASASPILEPLEPVPLEALRPLQNVVRPPSPRPASASPVLEPLEPVPLETLRPTQSVVKPPAPRPAPVKNAPPPEQNGSVPLESPRPPAPRPRPVASIPLESQATLKPAESFFSPSPTIAPRKRAPAPVSRTHEKGAIKSPPQVLESERQRILTAASARAAAPAPRTTLAEPRPLVPPPPPAREVPPSHFQTVLPLDTGFRDVDQESEEGDYEPGREIDSRRRARLIRFLTIQGIAFLLLILSLSVTLFGPTTGDWISVTAKILTIAMAIAMAVVPILFYGLPDSLPRER